MSRLKCTLAGKCGWQISSLPLITLLVCTSLHHICPSQIWCIIFSFNARYCRTLMYAKKTFLRLWNCQILNLDFFLFNGVYLFQTPRKWSAGIVITAPLYQSKQVLFLLGHHLRARHRLQWSALKYHFLYFINTPTNALPATMLVNIFPVGQD